MDPSSLPVAQAMFPNVAARRGMYESFYLRAVSPKEPVGVWIRYTVHKRPDGPPRGSLWFTWFDRESSGDRPLMDKYTTEGPSVPSGGWIEIGPSRLGPDRAEGSCGEARWSLGFAAAEPELRHLPSRWLYRLPLPRTKLTSPAPLARFDGTLELPGRTIHLDAWLGMIGHNWGAEHAERWIWLSGLDFDDAPDTWIDVALGRILIAGRMTPWIANGVLSLEGRRHRLGGLGARGLQVTETARGATLSLPGSDRLVVHATAQTPPGMIAGWRYADPDGSEHQVANCSIADLTLTVGDGVRPPRVLRTGHGAAYELGMREHDHGIPIAPFPDG